MSNLSGTETFTEIEGGGSQPLKLQSDTPHLVSMGTDRLTSVTLHPIPQGRLIVGSGPGVDILVQGTGVLPIHCRIENVEGVVTVYPLSDNLFIDGEKVCGATRLSQGVMLTIGKSNYLRFNHPREAKILKSVVPYPRISTDQDIVLPSKFHKKPPLVPKKRLKEVLDVESKEPIESNIMAKVSKFEYLAQQNFKQCISPKVFSSNLVTVNTPAKDVLGKSPPNLQNFSKNLPQNALNYSELNSFNEKQQSKTPDRCIFGKKSPHYVNVTLNEKNIIKNRVMIYENGCIPKNLNISLDHNELNNKSLTNTKNIKLNFNRNPSPQFRSITSTSNNVQMKRSGSLEEVSRAFDPLENLTQRNNEAEFKRSQAHQARKREEELGKAEQVRLEEILNICVEYEKQAQCEKHKFIPNRIKTNGSLPRDKRQYGPLSPGYTTPPSSPREIQNDIKRNNYSYENLNISPLRDGSNTYGNSETKLCDKKTGVAKYDNSYENANMVGSIVVRSTSPKKHIKTVAVSNKDNLSKETAEVIENKFAILEAEQFLLQNMTRSDQKSNTNRVLPSNNNKFVASLEDTPLFIPTAIDNNNVKSKIRVADKILSNNDVHVKNKIELLKRKRKELLNVTSSIKRQIAEIKIHEEELQRDIELEEALICGERQSKLVDLDKLQKRKDKLITCAQKIDQSMLYHQTKQDEDQKRCKQKLQFAQENMSEIEEKLSNTSKADPKYEQIFEEYLQAQELLDNEKKAFEDLEFHHLEEEADWLASREEIQREIYDVSRNIELIEKQILELEQQTYNTLRNDNSELKALERKRIENLICIEEITNVLEKIESELSVFSNQESDQEELTDSDSDISRNLEMDLSNLSLNMVHDLSCSVLVCNTKTPVEHIYNMSQSFNEKLLQEKSVLESNITRKYPSQDDINRISKVTSNAPISLNPEQGSLGKKTLECLKDIERKRHLHLCQQGSHVIEQERQRVLALKQRVQHEVISQWSRNRQFSVYLDSLEFGEEDTKTRIDQSETNLQVQPLQNDDMVRSGPDERDSPRSMSEISEASVETGRRKKISFTNSKQRPLTRYLPITSPELDLRQHIESAGHQVVLCPHIIITSTVCRGFLHKKRSKLSGWSRKWFVFDRNKHTLTYYNDKTEKKPRGGAYFQAIEEVYLDHLNKVKSPNPQLTFVIKTHERYYYLMAPSLESMRIWIDVIFTGAEGYQEFEHGC